MSEAVREGVPSRGPGMSTLLFLTLTLTHTLTHTTTVTAQLFPSTTDATATGHREFIEEYRHDLQHPDYTPHTHTLTHSLHNTLAEYPQPPGCLPSLPQGLVEFSDFGPMNNLPYRDVYAVSPGHADVTGISHFGFLDAYGARLKGDELEVLVSSERDMECGGDGVSECVSEGVSEGVSGRSEGFLTKSGDRVTTLTMHYESSSMGYGRGDSGALAPPLRIRAVTKSDIVNELAMIASSDKGGCYCDLMVPTKVTYAMGLLYYPQYGHTLFNGLSNIVATLWRKNISYSDVEMSVNLYRNTSTRLNEWTPLTYRLSWRDMYNELFSFFSADITQWNFLLNHALLHNKTVCFNRILVGALPHLDLMNISAPQELYSKYSREIIANFYWQELQLINGVSVDVTSPHDVTSEVLNSFKPAQYPDYHSELSEDIYDDSNDEAWIASTVTPYCAVTFVTRDVYNARSIVNVQELANFAESKGCAAKIISMENLTMKDQVGEVRWNTTLFVAVDGSALFNTLFMHKCSSVMYVEMWRRAMMYPKFEPAVWTGFIPKAADASFPNISDPIAQHLHDLISVYTAAGKADELETLNLNILPFPNKEIEQFLRNRQSVRIPVKTFEHVLNNSIQHNKQCRLADSVISPADDITDSDIRVGVRMVFKKGHQ